MWFTMKLFHNCELTVNLICNWTFSLLNVQNSDRPTLKGN